MKNLFASRLSSLDNAWYLFVVSENVGLRSRVTIGQQSGSDDGDPRYSSEEAVDQAAEASTSVWDVKILYSVVCAYVQQHEIRLRGYGQLGFVCNLGDNIARPPFTVPISHCARVDAADHVDRVGIVVDELIPKSISEPIAVWRRQAVDNRGTQWQYS